MVKFERKHRGAMPVFSCKGFSFRKAAFMGRKSKAFAGKTKRPLWEEMMYLKGRRVGFKKITTNL